MKKFLIFVLSLLGFLLFGFITLVFCKEIFVLHNYDLVNWYCLFFYGFLFLSSILQMVEVFKQTDNPETEKLKTDNPENDEIITVTEIKGVKKIIKNGKVIYCEQLKADELKVFEQLNEKNPTVTSGIKTYSKE